MVLFDIHSHMLPGVDDGSKNMEMSLDMLSIAYNEGVRNIILTPHYILGRNSYTYDELDSRFDSLKEEVRKSGKYEGLTFILGMRFSMRME